MENVSNIFSLLVIYSRTNRMKVSLIVRPTAVILLTVRSIENPNRDLKEVVMDPNLVKV